MLPPRFDIHEVEAFTDSMSRIPVTTRSMVVIDATRVKHIDQAGIDALRRWQAYALAKRIPLTLDASTTVRVAYELVCGIALDWISLDGRTLDNVA